MGLGGARVDVATVPVLVVVAGSSVVVVGLGLGLTLPFKQDCKYL